MIAVVAVAAAIVAAANDMSHTLKLVAWLLGLLAIVGAAYAAYLYFHIAGSSTPSYLTLQITQPKLLGDDKAAYAKYQAVMNDPNASNEDKARASILNAGAGAHVTGDPAARLDDVRRLKQIVTDNSLTVYEHVDAINLLATAYNDSGRDKAVFQEIYKDAPFSAFLVPNDPQMSALNLAEWSYGLAPSSEAAITVAQLASGKYFSSPNQSTSTVASYISTAEDYLKKAEAASKAEQTKLPNIYQKGERYLVYRIWRAITIGRLAIEAGEPYKSQYRQEYEDFFKYASALPSVHGKDEVFYARFQYARILALDNDPQTEKQQLDLLAQGLNGISDSYSFVWLLRNEHKNAPTVIWSQIQDMTKVSSDFKAAVDKIIGNN